MLNTLNTYIFPLQHISQTLKTTTAIIFPQQQLFFLNRKYFSQTTDKEFVSEQDTNMDPPETPTVSSDDGTLLTDTLQDLYVGQT